jgi:ATP-dependent 26S proteasome regulatory subunit
MRRTPSDEARLSEMLGQLVAVGEGALGIEQKVELAQLIRLEGPDGGRRLDHYLLDTVARQGLGLAEARGTQEKLRAILARLSATPWYPAVFLRPLSTPLGERALIVGGEGTSVVEVAEDVDLGALAAGDEVLLGRERNVVMARSPGGVLRAVETAFFDRRTASGRLVLRWRDEEVVVDAAAALAGAVLAEGDQVRWDRATGLAVERIERPAPRRFLLEDVPDIGRDRVGGQDANLERLLAVLTVGLLDSARAGRYGLGSRKTVLLVGPPGNGKTLLARIATAEIQRLSGKRCRFGVVKPAEWESPWVGETQHNIRLCFEALREAAREGCVVLFLDEVEAVGRIRGDFAGHHSDKFLAALLAELDGFTDRGNVAIVAATNRKDLVDPALLERLSDTEIQVRRPDRDGARAILGIHLPAWLPWAPGPEARAEVIERAVSRFYSPNAERALSTLRFRDGRTRTVVASDLASGRTFEQICRAACLAAFLRDVESGGADAGVRLDDMEEAVADAFERLATTLSPRNAHAHLADLPEDVDVVGVEPVLRRVGRPHRYRSAA